MNGHEQRQIDELKDDVRNLGKQLNDFTAEARERGAEIVGLLNTAVATAQGDRSRLESEVRGNKLACDDNHDRAMKAVDTVHDVAMQRIDRLKAERRWLLGTAVTGVIAAIVAMIGGWAENVFGR